MKTQGELQSNIERPGSFTEKVIEIVKKIPKGKTMTYLEVAMFAGSKASRVVGIIMAKNTDTSVPCHRVIRSDGSLGKYNGLRGKSKKQILQSEGFVFEKNLKKN